MRWECLQICNNSDKEDYNDFISEEGDDETFLEHKQRIENLNLYLEEFYPDIPHLIRVRSPKYGFRLDKIDEIIERKEEPEDVMDPMGNEIFLKNIILIWNSEEVLSESPLFVGERGVDV